jgi:hypothetical protein
LSEPVATPASTTIPVKLEPGLLVGVSTSVVGGAQRVKVEIDHHEDGSSETTRWETTQTIQDKEEYEAANRLRAKIRKAIAGVCRQTMFGVLICPSDREVDLAARIAEGKAKRDAFNATSVHSKIRLAVICGTIAETKGEAAQALSLDLATRLGDLQTMIAAGDVGSIREICTRLAQDQKLLEQKSSARATLGRAVITGRRLARDIKKAIDAGEQAASVIEEANTSPIAAARFVFTKGAEAGTEEAAAEGEVRDDEALPGVSISRFAGIAGDGEETAEEPEAPAVAPRLGLLDAAGKRAEIVDAGNAAALAGDVAGAAAANEAGLAVAGELAEAMGFPKS